MAGLSKAIGSAGQLALAAARSFLATLALAAVLAVIVASLTYYILRARTSYGLLVAALSVVEVLVCATVLGGKRALGVAVAEGIRVSGLGTYVVGLIFDRMLGVRGDAEAGEKSWAARTAEKLPLAQAEQKLHDISAALIQGDATSPGVVGWFRRALHARLVAAAQKYTLQRFRAEAQATGGVDLVQVRAALESSADRVLLDIVRRDSKRVVIVGCVALILLALVQAFVVPALLQGDPSP